MKGHKVSSLSAYRNRDSIALVEYLAKRCADDDLRGLFAVSIDRGGKFRVHATGKCANELDEIMGKVLSLTMQRAAGGGFDDPLK